MKSFWFCCYYKFVVSYYYNDLIKLLQSLLVILLCWYKRYSIFLISFFNLFELFPAFISACEIGNLVISSSGVKILIPVPVFYLFLFRGINFTISAIVSSGVEFEDLLSSWNWSSISLPDLLCFRYLLSTLSNLWG